MLLYFLLSLLASNSYASQSVLLTQEIPSPDAMPDFSFSREWQVLGPFQIGTREATWGADPLERYGGFHTLEYDDKATFRSSLTANAISSWSTREAILSYDSNKIASAQLSVGFPDVDWQWLRGTYGWAALQWQAWARGEIYISSEDVGVMILNMEAVLEYWIDDQHYFGGDYYGNKRAPVTLRLSRGAHRLNVRLVRDVRAMGGIGEPSVDIKLELKRSRSALVRTNPEFDEGVLISEVVGRWQGQLASPYASVTVRNDMDKDIYITGIESLQSQCLLELVGKTPIRLLPGQTRPIGFLIGCVKTYDTRLSAELVYRAEGADNEQRMHLGVWPKVLETKHELHRITYLHPSGIVSYAILRPPSPQAKCPENAKVPVMLFLHGAGVDADSEEVKHSLDDLGDLCAWTLFASGVTPWCGDDWHVWGLADVEAAVAAIPKWIEHVDWAGPGVDVDRWLVSGHSNGGQGVWHVLTHRPDKVLAAAAVSGYSSIQNYVPYSLWHNSDPDREAVIQATLLNYRHELLLENAKDIPVFQEHGTIDDNVPVYHSRLLAHRIQEAGANSTYYEVAGKNHWWDGVMTTEPLAAFFDKHLKAPDQNGHYDLTDFTIVLSHAGHLGTVHGVKVLSLVVPAKLAKLRFSVDRQTSDCNIDTINVHSFSLVSDVYDKCRNLVIDRQPVNFDAIPREDTIFALDHTGERWQAVSIKNGDMAEEQGVARQLGGMDAILKSKGAFSIVTHSNGTNDIALQISRNLCQYLAADTDINRDYEAALNSKGNVISIAIGDQAPVSVREDYPINVAAGKVSMKFNGRTYSWTADHHPGLAAIYLQPLPGAPERLELVIWGADRNALRASARLLPILTGSGQPDFVVLDQTMMWKGIEGTLAIGFFDSSWRVSPNSYLAV